MFKFLGDHHYPLYLKVMLKFKNKNFLLNTGQSCTSAL